MVDGMPEGELRGDSRFAGGIGGTLAKVLLLGLLDAFAVWAIVIMVGLGMWVPIAVVVIATGLINYIYLGRDKRLPAKYLTPGVTFLLVFQVFVIGYSGYIAFTNYSDGHSGSKADAIAAISAAGEKRIPGTPSYRVTVVEAAGGDLGLLLTGPDGEVLVGTALEPLSPVEGAEVGMSGAATEAPGYTTLTLSQVLERQNELVELRVPVSTDPLDGWVRTDDASSAYVFRPDLVYDPAQDTFTDQNGAVWRDDGNGAFRSADGSQTLTPGWRVNVGFANFQKAFTNAQLAGPLLRVLAWTFGFAVLSVLTTFAMGLFVALLLNHPRLRGKKIYRVLVILPYAFPGFLSALVWAGLMNPEFGFINQALFGGLQIPWLANPWLARLSVLIVNLWLGYPYMFLVSTGALQSLPADVEEAARVDGASAWRAFISIKLPLLLVSLAPLLIASFAFNFNNFNLVYMLTKGAPRFTDTTFDIGATDLLITMVYKIAFGMGGGRDYALASALSILIFILVATVAVIAFRRTRTLEEIH